MSPVREAAPGARRSDAGPAVCPTQTGTDAVASRLANNIRYAKITRTQPAAKMAPARANACGPPDNGRAALHWRAGMGVSDMPAPAANPASRVPAVTRQRRVLRRRAQEQTRRLDVRARSADSLAGSRPGGNQQRGAVVVLCSTDNQELAEVCDRVAVFYQGPMVGELTRLDEHVLLEAVNTGIVQEAA